MRSVRCGYGSVLLPIGFIVSMGCAVLTSSQLDEINQFGKAAKAYGTLPGEPIRQYGVLSAKNRLIDIAARDLSGKEEASKGWERLLKAIEIPAQFDKDADELDKTLAVLTQYADMLDALTAKDAAGDLETAATNLGQSLDKVIMDYNQKVAMPNRQSNLKLIGSIVAGAIRGAGGVFIKTKQAAYAKKYVQEANDIIPTLTNSIVELMAKMKDHFGTKKTDLKNNFIILSDRTHELGLDTTSKTLGFVDIHALSLDTLQFFEIALQDIDHSQELCTNAATAASKLKDAHDELVRDVEVKQDLKGMIAEIKALKDEIEVGLNLKTKLSKS